MKRCISLLILLGSFLVSNAAPVSRDEASLLAASFLKQRSVTEVKVPFEHFYVFNGGRGFVLISADDSVLPVLGYSFGQPFVSDMSEATLEWLRAYNDQIQDVLETGVEASDEVKAAWRSLRSSGRLPVCNRDEVYPLVYTRWSQRSPYNMYCPGESVTGCVAIAMAQIMRYWEYPARGNGSHAYLHAVYGLLNADFGATEYDWDHMPAAVGNSSSAVNKEAIATLVYHCGVSVDMKYSPEASSTPSTKVLEAMPTYFGYDTTIRMWYKDELDVMWKNRLKSELDAMRPLYYAGQDRGAHAFICDGYDASDYFHFNWGWGGGNDGYYAIGSLNPGNYTYNVLNYAIMGIKPADGSGPAIPAPVDLDVYPSGYDVVLEWQMPFDNPHFTYRVARNGTVVASGLTDPSFIDCNLTSGRYTYQVWSELNGFESEKDISREVEMFRIDAVSADPLRGTVWGGGLEELGVGHVVRAIPNPGYSFYAWVENGAVVSTESELIVVAEEDRFLTACFSNDGVDENEGLPVIRKVEVFALNGIKLETLDNLNMETFVGYAKGVYVLRLFTEAGVMTKKILIK